MLTALIPILLLVIVLLVIWYAVGLFGLDGRIHKIIGLIFALIILIFALDKFGYHL